MKPPCECSERKPVVNGTGFYCTNCGKIYKFREPPRFDIDSNSSKEVNEK